MIACFLLRGTPTGVPRLFKVYKILKEKERVKIEA